MGGRRRGQVLEGPGELDRESRHAAHVYRYSLRVHVLPLVTCSLLHFSFRRHSANVDEMMYLLR